MKWLRFSKPKKCVHCSNCAHFMALAFAGDSSPSPICLATATFTSGPLRNAIDVGGLEDAIARNTGNQCSYWAKRSRLSVAIKRFIQETSGDLVRLLDLDEIPFELERKMVDSVDKSSVSSSDHRERVSPIPLASPTKKAEEEVPPDEVRTKKSNNKKASNPEAQPPKRKPRRKKLTDLGPVEQRENAKRLQDSEFAKRALASYQ